MKFTLAATLALVSVAAADKMITHTYCSNGNHGCNSRGTWRSDTDIYELDANQGCHPNPPPIGMVELCMDWGVGHATARFSGQGKRCFRRQGSWPCGPMKCNDWIETAC